MTMGIRRRGLLLGGAALVGTAAAWRVCRGSAVAAARPIRARRVDSIPAAEPGSALDFLVTGDSGQESLVRERVLAAMADCCARLQPDFLVLTGDNVYPHGVVSAVDPAWKVHFEDVFARLRLPVYPCLGNHDHEGNAEAQVEYSNLQPLWRLPAARHWFSRAVSPGCEAAFFFLDTQPLRTGFPWLFRDEQVAWLDQALAQSTASWKIVVGHHPLYSGGPKGGSSKLGRALQPVFAERAVDLYLSGHDHTLELLDPVLGWLQVVSGASSAPDPVAAIEQTLFQVQGGGFVWVSIRQESLWIQFLQPEQGALASFCVERGEPL